MNANMFRTMRPNNGRLWAKVNNDKFEIRSLTQDKLEEALNILDASFFLNESVCNGCEINLPENRQSRLELRELCRITAEDGVSLVVVEATSGKIVSVAFNKIQFLPDNNEEPFFIKFRNESTHSIQAQALMDFMIEVDGKVDVFSMFKIDSLCELMFLATLPDYERNGFGNMVTKYTIELTRELSQGIGLDDINPDLRTKRPKAVTAIFTSLFSQKIGKLNDFQILSTNPYTEFIFNGKTFDQRINPMHKNSHHVVLLI
ncbi:uncharacterized protein LOC119685384 [Teleopsis dalmanni]|uniref:uncharacterized protein LOC119685384 n=1 Tax=Teleopsis dalmanni TaxID=139649 RepID=UPI0018CD7170|nr:uncharacterized protein LOC119685384 [Teleopsis dalmanni]